MHIRLHLRASGDQQLGIDAALRLPTDETKKTSTKSPFGRFKDAEGDMSIKKVTSEAEPQQSEGLVDHSQRRLPRPVASEVLVQQTLLHASPLASFLELPRNNPTCATHPQDEVVDEQVSSYKGSLITRQAHTHSALLMYPFAGGTTASSFLPRANEILMLPSVYPYVIAGSPYVIASDNVISQQGEPGGTTSSSKVEDKLLNNKAKAESKNQQKKKRTKKSAHGEETQPESCARAPMVPALERWNRSSALFRTQKVIMPKSFTPSEDSVLLGHKREFREAEGNMRLKDICLGFHRRYDEADRDGRREIVTTILKMVYHKCPIGAFLRYRDGRFYEVEDLLAREKIAADLRNFLPHKYRSAKTNRLVLYRQEPSTKET